MSIEQIATKTTQALALSWLVGITTRTHLQALSIRQVLPISTVDQLALIIGILYIVGITFCTISPRVSRKTIGRHGNTVISDVDVAG